MPKEIFSFLQPTRGFQFNFSAIRVWRLWKQYFFLNSSKKTDRYSLNSHRKRQTHQTEVDVNCYEATLIILEIDGNVVFLGICEKILLHYLTIFGFDVDN